MILLFAIVKKKLELFYSFTLVKKIILYFHYRFLFYVLLGVTADKIHPLRELHITPSDERADPPHTHTHLHT